MVRFDCLAVTILFHDCGRIQVSSTPLCFYLLDYGFCFKRRQIRMISVSYPRTFTKTSKSDDDDMKVKLTITFFKERAGYFIFTEDAKP